MRKGREGEGRGNRKGGKEKGKERERGKREKEWGVGRICSEGHEHA